MCTVVVETISNWQDGKIIIETANLVRVHFYELVTGGCKLDIVDTRRRDVQMLRRQRGVAWLGTHTHTSQQ